VKTAVFDPAPPWKAGRCEILTLWHGCTRLDSEGMSAGIDLTRSRLNLDFGRGFYTTTLRRQAVHWAIRRFDSRFVSKIDNWPVVLRFAIRRVELTELKSLSFVLAGYQNEDYWSLVQHCRGSRPGNMNDHLGPVTDDGQWYDAVSGPVVADWRQRAALIGMDQISFHTKSAMALLNGAITSGKTERYECQSNL